MDYDLQDECYTLKADNMWVSVKKFEIRIHTTDEGVVVDIYQGSEEGACGDALASTYAFDNECEEDMQMREEPKIVWLVKGRITCPDVADMWSAQIGDPEFRLLDHPTNPSSSSDHPTHLDAMQYAATQGLTVIERRKSDG